MSLSGGQGDSHPESWITVITIFQPGGADYAHHITACPPRFENLTASLIAVAIYAHF